MNTCSRPGCHGPAVAVRATGYVCRKHSRIFSGKVKRPKFMGPIPDYSWRYRGFTPSPVLQQEHCVWLIDSGDCWRPCGKPMAELDQDGQPLCRSHARVTI